MKRAWCIFLLACAAPHRTAEERGRALYESTKTGAASNPFSCATCHERGPGGSLAGVTARPSFWGGQRLDLLESINDCRLSFMDARASWTRDDPSARDLYAYLASLRGSSTPVRFTTDVAASHAAGDAAKGKPLYARACAPCHGTIHDASGRIASFVPALPDEPKATHAANELRAAFEQKVRKGAFAGASGSMPPFSAEALSPEDLANVLAYLGL